MAKKVLVSGCYDLLHSGHVEFFRQASEFGDLYVGIGSDATIQEYKHIVTGEGKSDLQTLGGKVAHGVLRHSKGIPVALVSGRIEDIKALREAGFSKFIQATPEDMSLAEALKKDTALRNLAAAATSIA